MKNFLSTILGLFFAVTAIAAPPITYTMEQNLGGLMYRNFVKNPGAEKNITSGITNSSSIVTRSTTTPIEGVAQFAIDGTANAQDVDWALNTQDQGLKNAGCEARWVISGDATLYKLQVLSGSTVIAENATLSNYTSPQMIVLPVSCGDLSTTYKLRIETTSSSAAAILVDSVYYGRATNLANVAQATFYGSLRYVGATSCDWTTSSSSYSDFAADTDCVTPTVVGNAVAPGTKIPAVVFNNMPPGNYQVILNLPYFNSTGGAGTGCQLVDDLGTVASNSLVNTASSNDSKNMILQGNFVYTTAQSSRTFKLQCATGSGTIEINNANSTRGELQYWVYKYPTQGQVIASDQTNTTWQSYTLTIGATTTPPTPGTSTSLALWRREGSDMLITYYFSQPGSGTAGSGTYLFPIPSGYTIDTTKVQATTDTIGTIGTAVGSGQATNTASATSTTAGPMTMFVRNSTNLYAIHSNTGGQLNPIGSSEISIGGTAYFAFFARVPILGWTPTQTYYIPGSVTSNVSGTERLERATIVCSSSSSITSQSGSWLTSVGNVSSGKCTVTLAIPFSSTAYVCSFARNGTSVTTMSNISINNKATGSFDIYMANISTGSSTIAAGTNETFDMTCMGPK